MRNDEEKTSLPEHERPGRFLFGPKLFSRNLDM